MLSLEFYSKKFRVMFPYLSVLIHNNILFSLIFIVCNNLKEDLNVHKFIEQMES